MPSEVGVRTAPMPSKFLEGVGVSDGGNSRRHRVPCRSPNANVNFFLLRIDETYINPTNAGGKYQDNGTDEGSLLSTACTGIFKS